MKTKTKKLPPELSDRSQTILDELVELLENEHVHGCDSDTCNINTAHAHGFSAWACYLFDGCGAASDEFSRIYSKLPKSFYKYAHHEADLMCESVEHAECPKCNAVVWHDGHHGSDIYCDSCGNSF